MPDLDVILNDRGIRYGLFKEHARISQMIKNIMFEYKDKVELDADQREALEMIAHKIARIINGDPNHIDSWIDIAGYAQLVADRLEGKIR